MKKLLLNLTYPPLFLLAFVLVPPLLTLYLLVQAPFISHRAAMRKFRNLIKVYGRIMLGLLWPWVKIVYEDHGGEPTPGCIYVCNHRSSSDPFMMAFPPGETIQVPNAWPFRLPFLGWMARRAGYLSVREMEVADFYRRGKEYLDDNINLATFPEGTRSTTGEMGPFHSTVFRLALRAQAPIVPICLSGTGTFMPKGSLILSPCTIRVRRLPQIAYDDYKDMSPFQLKNHVHDVIDAELKRMEGKAAAPPSAPTIAPGQFPWQDILAAVEQRQLLALRLSFGAIHDKPRFPRLESPAAKPLTATQRRELIVAAKTVGVRRVTLCGVGDTAEAGDLLQVIGREALTVEVELIPGQLTEAQVEWLNTAAAEIVFALNRVFWRERDAVAAQAALQEALNMIPERQQPRRCSTVLCRESVTALPAVSAWLREQQVDLQIAGVGTKLDDVDRFWLRENADAIQDAVELVSAGDEYPLAGSNAWCAAPLFSCCVDRDGNVFADPGIDLVIGNLHEQTLVEVLRDSEVLEDIRAWRETISGPCADCDLLNRCGGCRAVAYELTGDYLASDPLCRRNAERRDDIDGLPLAAETVIPHRKPMRLVDRILEIGDRYSWVEAAVTADWPFLQAPGKVEDAAYLELMAQATAADDGFRNRCRKQGLGFLIGAKKLEVLGQASVGDVLTIHMFKDAKLDNFGILVGTVLNGDECIARGEIKVYREPEGESS